MNPQSLNRYAYALNNPTTLTDPLGLSCGGGGFLPDLPGAIVSISSAPCPDWFPTNLNPPCSDMDGMGCGYNSPSDYGYGNGSSGGGGALLGRGIVDTPATLGPPPQAQPLQACVQPIPGGINNMFGTKFTSADVGTGQFQPFQYPQVPGGTVNIDVFVPQQDQPNGVSSGRYPIHWWSYIIGYGPTLHIPSGHGGLDSPSTLIFSNSQFTAHIDSAYPYNPIGFGFHIGIDVLGIGGHRPCP